MHRLTGIGIVGEFLCRCYVQKWVPMTGSELRFAVFYGETDQKRGQGWYWTAVPGPAEPSKGPYNGPFETKADAIEHAIRSGAGRLH
jgi:hypothetical protein